jgi:transcriptional regulator with XRE-family HTH domain
MPGSSLSKKFGCVIRRERVAAGLSQEQLAERAGLHPTYIGMIERGVRNATLEVAARLARALKKSLPCLLEDALKVRGSGGHKG